MPRLTKTARSEQQHTTNPASLAGLSKNTLRTVQNLLPRFETNNLKFSSMKDAKCASTNGPDVTFYGQMKISSKNKSNLYLISHAALVSVLTNCFRDLRVKSSKVGLNFSRL